jgi:epoxyqueuosine reductase
MKGKFDDWAFGCDVCQDVCPGISSKPHNQPLFNPNPELLHVQNWIELTEETFKTVFKDSPLKEPSLRALGNVDFIK